MINMTNRPNVYVRLGTIKLLLTHDDPLPYIL